MTVQGQARTGNVPGPGVAGAKSGRTPGVRENDPPKPGEVAQTPWEIEGPYYRLGTPPRHLLCGVPQHVDGRPLGAVHRPVSGIAQHCLGAIA